MQSSTIGPLGCYIICGSFTAFPSHCFHGQVTGRGHLRPPPGHTIALLDHSRPSQLPVVLTRIHSLRVFEHPVSRVVHTHQYCMPTIRSTFPTFGMAQTRMEPALIMFCRNLYTHTAITIQDFHSRMHKRHCYLGTISLIPVALVMPALTCR